MLRYRDIHDKPNLPFLNFTSALAWIRRHILLLACGGSFAAALALRIYRLDAQSLWLDEGNTWAEVVGNNWHTLIGDLVRPTSAYPLYYLLLKLWIAIAGDTEWTLRFPSALAGALTTLAMFLAASELLKLVLDGQPQTTARSRQRIEGMVVATLLFAASPFALWYAQEAKVYSVLMLVIALLLWTLLRALRCRTPRAWLIVITLAVISLFVHRLALLSTAAVVLVGALIWTHDQPTQLTTLPFRIRNRKFIRAALIILALGLATAGIFGLAHSGLTNDWQESGHVPAGPFLGLWLTFVHFSLDRGNIDNFAGLPLLIWLLPCATLTLWGLALLVRDAIQRQPQAFAVLCMFIVPLLLFIITLEFAPIYESRYATIVFPTWVLVLTYPFMQQGIKKPEQTRTVRLSALYLILCSVFLVNVTTLLQPKYGLFSGAPVKEEWRTAIQFLAREMHPDDLLILHPYYTLPLWNYYAPRVTPDPLPQPVVFTDFSQGYCVERYPGSPQEIRDCFRRETDRLFLEKAYGKKRAFLLIAPEHARTIDRPKTLAELQAERSSNEPQPTEPDKYGWVGLRFQIPQNTWPCGGMSFVGVEVMCQSYPSAFGKTGAEAALQPSVPLEATFGGEIKLRGYSLDLFGGQVRAGGSLPITLYWEAITKPTNNYTMFLHLCRDCTIPPLAHNDHPPLNGYAPAGQTTTWRIGDPVHDERTLQLPADLQPGRYTVLLGVYPSGNPAAGARLQASSHDAEVLDGTRVVLCEIEVTN